MHSQSSYMHSNIIFEDCSLIIPQPGWGHLVNDCLDSTGQTVVNWIHIRLKKHTIYLLILLHSFSPFSCSKTQQLTRMAWNWTFQSLEKPAAPVEVQSPFWLLLTLFCCILAIGCSGSSAADNKNVCSSLFSHGAVSYAFQFLIHENSQTGPLNWWSLVPIDTHSFHHNSYRIGIVILETSNGQWKCWNVARWQQASQWKLSKWSAF